MMMVTMTGDKIMSYGWCGDHARLMVGVTGNGFGRVPRMTRTYRSMHGYALPSASVWNGLIYASCIYVGIGRDSLVDQ